MEAGENLGTHTIALSDGYRYFLVTLLVKLYVYEVIALLFGQCRYRDGDYIGSRLPFKVNFHDGTGNDATVVVKRKIYGDISRGRAYRFG